MKPAVLAIAFLLELVAFVFFAAIAFTLPVEQYAQIIIAAILFAAVIAVWSLFMAPRASKKLMKLPYYLVKFCIYAVSAYSILMITGAFCFELFVALVILDEVLLYRHNLS